LQYGLALVLVLIGIKMVLEEAAHTFEFHLPAVMESPFLSLIVISSIFTGAIVLSKLFPSSPEDDPHGLASN